MRVFVATCIFFLLIGCGSRQDRGTFSSPELDSGRHLANFSRDSTLEIKLSEMYSAVKNDLLPESSLTLLKSSKLNDSVTYCVFELRDGLCVNSYLAVQSSMLSKQVVWVGQNCDADFSVPERIYSEIEFGDFNGVRTVQFIERAELSYLIKEEGVFHFKEGFDMENAGKVRDTSIVLRLVQSNGDIKEKNIEI